jgi:hypothetical protein
MPLPQFCINPDCPDPHQPGDEDECAQCGTELLLELRYRPLHPIASTGMTRVFQVQDQVEQVANSNLKCNTRSKSLSALGTIAQL